MDSLPIARRVDLINDLEEDRIRAAQTSRLSFSHQQPRGPPTTGSTVSSQLVPENPEAPASVAAAPLSPAVQNVAAATSKPRVRIRTNATSKKHLAQMLEEAISIPMSNGSIGQHVAAERQAIQHGEDSKERSHYKCLPPLIYRPQNVRHESKDTFARNGENDLKEDHSKGEDGLCGRLLSRVTGGRKDNKR